MGSFQKGRLLDTSFDVQKMDRFYCTFHMMNTCAISIDISIERGLKGSLLPQYLDSEMTPCGGGRRQSFYCLLPCRALPGLLLAIPAQEHKTTVVLAGIGSYYYLL